MTARRRGGRPPGTCPRCGGTWRRSREYRCPGCGVSRYEADPTYGVRAHNAASSALAKAHPVSFRRHYERARARGEGTSESRNAALRELRLQYPREHRRLVEANR